MGSLNAQSPDSFAIKQVDSLIGLAKNQIVKRDFDKALEIIAAAEKFTLENLGSETPQYCNIIFARGSINYSKGDYNEAEKWLFKTKECREKNLGKEHPDYALGLNYLAYVNQLLRNYDKAESLFIEALEIQKKVLGKENAQYGGSLTNLAGLYNSLGKYEKAEPLILEAKSIMEKALGKVHPKYGNCLNTTALLYLNLGELNKAERFFLEAKSIQENSNGKENQEYANVINNLAIVYRDLGNYPKAEALWLESMGIKEKLFGKESLGYASSANNMGSLYYAYGDFGKSEMYNLLAKDIKAKLLGKEHPDYASSVNNLALVYNRTGKFKGAESLLLEALTIYEKAFGNENIEYVNTSNNLANLYLDFEEYEKAEPVFLESKVKFEKILGKENRKYTNNLNGLISLYAHLNNFSKAEQLLVELIDLDQSMLISSTKFLSETELTRYIVNFKEKSDNLYSYQFALKKGSSGSPSNILPSLLFNNTLFYKGFLMNTSKKISILTNFNPKALAIKADLNSYRRRLSVEYSKPIAERKGVADLEEKANLAEKELVRSVTNYGDAVRQLQWKEVQTFLKKEEAAVEFVSFKLSFPKITDSIIYAALVIKPDNNQPVFIPLFEEKSLDSLLNNKSDRKADYVNSLYTLADRGVTINDGPKKSLYEIIWKPLEKALTGIKTIYFSPSGLLHRINLDAIPVSETETLADKYQLIELNSTRQLVIPDQVKITNNEATLFGGIQYELDSTIQNNEAIFASRSRGEPGFSSVDSTLRGGTWNYLAGTEREVTSIETIMQSAGVPVSVKKGYAATEESFKNIGANNSPSPGILHIATHGYFFPDPKVQAKSNGLIGQNESVFKLSDHPMLRSGIIMAGCNASWQGKQTLEGREDGILTAYEISQMNLSNTELVVLSACETGLGDIQGNEGVYGLQRAFKIAGVKYLIMSLWQVPDKQTSLLMTTFYKKWLEDKMTIPDAFHAAQKELREIGLDPYQWAGFVLVE